MIDYTESCRWCMKAPKQKLKKNPQGEWVAATINHCSDCYPIWEKEYEAALALKKYSQDNVEPLRYSELFRIEMVLQGYDQRF